MDILIASLERRRAAIMKALAALRELDDNLVQVEVVELPEANDIEVVEVVDVDPEPVLKSHGMSPQRRREISEMMKKRWAATRKPVRGRPRKKAPRKVR